MFCIGNTRISQVRVGTDLIEAVHIGSDSFDYLPYLFEAPKIIWLLTPSSKNSGDVESNIIWNVNN